MVMNNKSKLVNKLSNINKVGIPNKNTFTNYVPVFLVQEKNY